MGRKREPSYPLLNLSYTEVLSGDIELSDTLLSSSLLNGQIYL